MTAVCQRDRRMSRVSCKLLALPKSDVRIWVFLSASEIAMLIGGLRAALRPGKARAVAGLRRYLRHRVRFGAGDICAFTGADLCLLNDTLNTPGESPLLKELKRRFDSECRLAYP